MTDSVEQVSIERVAGGSRSVVEDTVIKETPLTILLNNQELATLLCSPGDSEYLAAGFLASEGLLSDKADIKSITLDDRRGIIRIVTREELSGAGEVLFKRLVTSGCGRGAAFYSAADARVQTRVDSAVTISTHDIFSLVKEFQRHSQVYRETGGVHSAALCEGPHIILFHEDIGRHNAIDKIFGECLLKSISVSDHTLVTSGRISSEVLLKTARRNVPVLISRSAPTNLAVRLAQDTGVTLIGFVRGERMNIYANGWRVTGSA